MKKHNRTRRNAAQLTLAYIPAPHDLVINSHHLAYDFIDEVCTPQVHQEHAFYTALLLDGDYTLIGYLHHCLETKGDENLDLGVLGAAICLSHAQKVVVACYQPAHSPVPQDGDYMLAIMLQALCGHLAVTFYDYIIHDASEHYSFQSHGHILDQSLNFTNRALYLIVGATNLI